MIVRGKVFIIGAELKEGVGKNSGKEYSMIQVTALDEKYNKLRFTASRDIMTDPVRRDMLLGLKEIDQKVTLDLREKGFDLVAELVGFE